MPRVCSRLALPGGEHTITVTAAGFTAASQTHRGWRSDEHT
jgi:hypothetical protein